VKYDPKRLEATEHYIQADKSDPFLRARIELHMSNGVCGFTPTGEDAFYAATAVPETLKGSDGSLYVTVNYQSRIRP
jgi:hypothetical protein